MKIKFLGTGTSTGIPQIACNCLVCKSDDVKDKRLRASILIEVEGKNILIDAGPDLRQQLITNNVTSIDAVLITHGHYDHIGGLDDVRPLGEIQLYAEGSVLSQIRTNMPYCFAQNPYPGVPTIQLNGITEEKFMLDNVAIQPIRVMHAKLPILAYRIGDFAYITDLKTISQESLDKLQGLDVLVLNALRINSHISHISLSEALELAERIGAKKTYFTHFSHDLGLHNQVQKTLPSNVFLAYDNLELNL